MTERSQHLIDSTQSGLLLIDLQTKLLPAIRKQAQVVWNARRLLDAAQALAVANIWATAQYPERLGPFPTELTSHPALGSERIWPKRDFSCCGDQTGERLRDQLAASGCRQLVLAGIESHVCVQQTALDLLGECIDVYVVADAVSSRFQHDCDWALRRLESQGATIVTTEAVLFEWCRTSLHPEFKTISRLVREPAPEE